MKSPVAFEKINTGYWLFANNTGSGQSIKRKHSAHKIKNKIEGYIYISKWAKELVTQS